MGEVGRSGMSQQLRGATGSRKLSHASDATADVPGWLDPDQRSIAFQNEGGRVVYFYGHLPVFQHETGDVQSFRLFTSQLIQQGSASQTEIVEAFGVPRITVKRYVK